jgi:hypothetical protein
LQLTFTAQQTQAAEIPREENPESVRPTSINLHEHQLKGRVQFLQNKSDSRLVGATCQTLIAPTLLDRPKAEGNIGLKIAAHCIQKVAASTIVTVSNWFYQSGHHEDCRLLWG